MNTCINEVGVVWSTLCKLKTALVVAAHRFKIDVINFRLSGHQYKVIEMIVKLVKVVLVLILQPHVGASGAADQPP